MTILNFLRQHDEGHWDEGIYDFGQRFEGSAPEQVQPPTRRVEVENHDDVIAPNTRVIPPIRG